MAGRRPATTVAERRSSAQNVRQSLQQRGADATRALRQVLGLPTNLNDSTLLGTSLAEVAAREMRQNPRFASEVRRVYDELVSLQKPTGKRARASDEELPPLVPIRRDLPFSEIDAGAPPDPQYIIQAYGAHQLARALHDYGVDALKRTAANIEAMRPGTKPTNRGQKKALIDYIVKYST